MKVLNIYDLLEERHIVKGYGGYALSGHIYKNSPFETSNSCSNCDGANCHICKKIPNDSIEVSIPSDELVQMLMKKGAPEDVAKDFAYDDTVNRFRKGYYFCFPTQSGLERERPDLVKAFYKAC